MPVYIPAVVTDDARKYWAQYLAGIFTGVISLDTVIPIATFRIGEGGWIDPGTGRVPRIPDPTLRRLDNNIQDIDCVVDPTRPLISQRYPLDSRASFEKALLPTDIEYDIPTTVKVSCLLDFGDFNDDGFGNFPELWEIGIFTVHPEFPAQKLMLAYGTFPMMQKNPGVQRLNVVRIVF